MIFCASDLNILRVERGITSYSRDHLRDCN